MRKYSNKHKQSSDDTFITQGRQVVKQITAPVTDVLFLYRQLPEDGD
jgi:hypothetical protein